MLVKNLPVISVLKKWRPSNRAAAGMNPWLKLHMLFLSFVQVMNGTPSVSEQLLNGGQLSGRLVWGVCVCDILYVIVLCVCVCVCACA